MAKQQVTLSINTTGDGETPSSSSTTIQTNSVSELHRLLDLAGIPGAYDYSTATPLPGAGADAAMGEVDEDETYKPSASNKVRKPSQLLNNPRFGDNSLKEDDFDMEPELDIDQENDFNNVDPIEIADTFHKYLKSVDHDEAIARTADDFGIPGERVEQVIDRNAAYESYDLVSEDFDDYNIVETTEAPAAPKGFKDYLGDFGKEREIQHPTRDFNVMVEWMDSKYESHFEKFVVNEGTKKEAEKAGIALAESNAKQMKTGFVLVDAEVEDKLGESYEAFRHYGKRG